MEVYYVQKVIFVLQLVCEFLINSLNSIISIVTAQPLRLVWGVFCKKAFIKGLLSI